MKTILVPPFSLGRRRLALASVGSLIALGSATSPAAESIQQLGTFGDHVADLASTGHLVGHSLLQSGYMQPRHGTVAWLGRPDGTSATLGFYDALHSADGVNGWETTVLEVNEHGLSIGYSLRYAGGEDSGSSAWVADRNGNEIMLGYYDAAHTSTEGRTSSVPVDLNEVDQVVGYSEGNTDARSAWLVGAYTPMTRIGLFDAAHTSADGRQWSTPVAINNAGHVAGISRFYNGRTAGTFGRTPWLRTSWGSTRLVGFQSGIHRSLNGWHSGSVQFLTNSGYLAGGSNRYNGHVRIGSTAWLTHVSGPNRPVGLYTGIHTAPNQIAVSVVQKLNEAGIAAGESLQFTGANPTEAGATGRSAWLARPTGQTVRVGLYDAEHTRNGRQINVVVALNRTDAAVGYAERFDPVTGSNTDGAGGRSAWVANLDGTTTRLGLEGPGTTRADGFHYSDPAGIAGNHVWGSTRTYDGRGELWWIYDRAAGSYTVLRDHPSAPEDFVNGGSRITHVQESGVAYGSYFGPLRAFMYVPGDQIYTLDDIVTPSHAQPLEEVVLVTPNGYIAAYRQGLGHQFATDTVLLKR